MAGRTLNEETLRARTSSETLDKTLAPFFSGIQSSGRVSGMFLQLLGDFFWRGLKYSIRERRTLGSGCGATVAASPGRLLVPTRTVPARARATLNYR